MTGPGWNAKLASELPGFLTWSVERAQVGVRVGRGRARCVRGAGIPRV